MKSLWSKITSQLEGLANYLITFGPLGLFAVALLDSALIPMPGAPDFILITLAMARPSWFWVYSAGAALGSTIGCVILYYISRRAGRRALDSFSEKKRARVKKLVDRYDVLSVMVASILPPPFPFKLFVITAGVFRLNVWRFALAIAAGRAFRFLFEGFLAARYGHRAKELMAQYYPSIAIGVGLLIVAFFLARNVLSRRRAAKSTPTEAG